MLDRDIRNTVVGKEFMWDRVSDVDLHQLQSTREAKMLVIANPHMFPNADLTACEKLVKGIDSFLREFGDLLAEFA